MAVRILSWNIFNFSTDITDSTPRINRVLDVVNPGGGPAYEVFVIIEPTNKESLSPGVLAMGVGPLGIQSLLAKLQARANGAGWKVAPPLSLALGSKSETIAVFYDSASVSLLGPDRNRTFPSPWNLSTADDGLVYYVNTNNNNLAHGDIAGTDLNVANTVTGQPAAVSIRLDLPNNRIFWIDSAGDIVRANLGGTNQGAATVVNGANAGSITIDGASDFVFYYDATNQEICRADAGGTDSNVITVVPNVTAAPLGITCDPFYGDVYWADTNARKIKKAKPGKHKYNLVNVVNNCDVTTLLVDLESEWMYWADNVAHTIEAASLDGTLTFTAKTATDALELAVDSGRSQIFWREANLVGRATLNRTAANTNVGTVLTNAGNYRGIQVDPGKRKIIFRDNAVIKKADAAGTDGNIASIISANAGPFIVDVGSVYTGKCVFNDVNGNAVHFPSQWQRRPYLVRFREIASNNEFLLLAAHSPSPHYSPKKHPTNGARKNNLDAQEGTEAIGSIADITANRANTPVVIVGDFNCCSIPVPDATCGNPSGHAIDINAQDSLATVDGAGYAYFSQALTILRGAIAATTAAEAADAENNTAANTLNAATAHGAANQAVAQAKLAGTAVTDAIAAVQAIPNTAAIRTGTLDAIVINATTAAQNCANLNTVVNVGALNTHQTDATTAKNYAVAARNQLLLMSNAFNACGFLHAFSDVIRLAAEVIDAPNAMGSPGAANTAGNRARAAATAAAGLAAAAADITTANNIPTGGANAGNCVARAKAARDAVLAIATDGQPANARIFTSHIQQQRTSLQAPNANATRVSHTKHAYDHVLSVGFTTVQNARLRDVLEELCVAWDVLNAPNIMTQNDFDQLHGDIWKGTGVSDHLPVEVTVTL